MSILWVLKAKHKFTKNKVISMQSVAVSETSFCNKPSPEKAEITKCHLCFHNHRSPTKLWANIRGLH